MITTWNLEGLTYETLFHSGSQLDYMPVEDPFQS